MGLDLDVKRQVIHKSSDSDLSPQPPMEVAIGILIEMRGPEGDFRPPLLITRRPNQTVLGGYWELPGGKLEPGETVSQCLVREFAEEVGLTIQTGETLPLITHQYEYGQVRLHPCLCTRTNGEPANLQVAEHRWVTADELPQYRFPPANAELMVTIAQRMNQVTTPSSRRPR